MAVGIRPSNPGMDTGQVFVCMMVYPTRVGLILYIRKWREEDSKGFTICRKYMNIKRTRAGKLGSTV